MRQKRKYLKLLEKSINAIHSAIDTFNRVYDDYKIETTLILITNAWELLAKAILVKKGKRVTRNKLGNTFSAEDTIVKLQSLKLINENQKSCIGQIISLRNYASHDILPKIPEEVLHHLFYFGIKFYKDLIEAVFPRYAQLIKHNYLSISFDTLTTYAEKVQKIVARLRRGSEGDKKLIWLLERGVQFDGAQYISQNQFEGLYKRKKKIMPYLKISDFIKKSEMIRIIPIQAPKNYTADVKLRKGKKSDASLPVFIKKTDIEQDYPYLTGELGKKLNKSGNFIAFSVKKLELRGDRRYHQSVRASKSSKVNRYSEATLHYLKKFFEENPSFSPFKRKS